MAYNIYTPEPLTWEMKCVMQDWFDGRDSMFFKVSIGESEDKILKPSVNKHFTAIKNEAAECLRIMDDKTAEEESQDVQRLQDVHSWACRQIQRSNELAALIKATKSALKYFDKIEVQNIVENTILSELSPTD